MSIPRRLPRRRRDRDERGAALVVAIGVMFVTVLFTTAAVEETVNGLTQSALANRQVLSTDAAESGVQQVVNEIDSAQAFGILPAKGGVAQSSITCPSGTQTITGSTGTYTLSYASAASGSSPDSAAAVLAANSGTTTACSGTIGMVPGTTYVIRSVGSTSATGVGTETQQATVYVPPQEIVSPSYTPESLWAANSVEDGGGLTVDGPNVYGPTSSSSYGDAGGVLSGAPPSNSATNEDTCGSSTNPTVIAGTYFNSGDNSSGSVPGNNLVAVNCTIGGSLYTNGQLNMTGGGIGYGTGGVGGLYAWGYSPTMNSTAGVAGTIESGAYTTISGGTVGDGIVSPGLTLGGGATVTDVPLLTGINSAAEDTLALASTQYQYATIVTTTSTASGNYPSGIPGDLTINAATVTAASGGDGIAIDANDANTTDSSGNTIAGYVNLNSGAVINGNIIANGPVTVAAGAKVNGSITASGTVTNHGTVTGTITSNAAVSTSPPDNLTNTALLYNWLDAIIPMQPGFLPGTMAIPQYTDADHKTWLRDQDFCGATECSAVTTSSPSTGAYCNKRTSATPTNAECLITDNDCALNDAAGGNSSIEDPNSVWALISEMELSTAIPTVIQTSCAFTWGAADEINPSTGTTSIPLYANLAIYDSNGFNLTGFPGFTSGDGAKHELLMLVPYTAGDVTSSSAVSCTVPSGESPSFSGEPDIVVGSALTDTSDNIENFLYTQNDICYTGTGTMSGKLLAGGNIYAESSTAKLTNYYTDIPTPWVGSGADTAPVVEQISRLGS